MQRLKMPEGEAIEHSDRQPLDRQGAERVEARNFDIRKQLLEYDDVANDQRQVIYQQRNELLESDDIADTIRNMIRGEIDDDVQAPHPAGIGRGAVGRRRSRTTLAAEYQLQAPVGEWLKASRARPRRRCASASTKVADAGVARKEAAVGAELMRQFERSLMLQTLDHHWREHLAALDHLRQGIHLRGYAQKNPKQEYKREAFELFSTCSTASSRTSSGSC